jgi:uncharacterized membrane protein YeaQ/YmgE (transglycosylase-associated protein family)
MTFVLGFALWILFGLAAAALIQRRYPAAGTTATLTFVFGFLGAVIGGMLGIHTYVFHDPMPLRTGGIIGGVAGALFFPFLYHFIARHAA